MTELYLYLLYAALLLLAAARARPEGCPAWWLPVAVLLKMAAGLWYCRHYWAEQGDMFHYFNDGRLFYNTFFEAPGYYLQNMLGLGTPEPPDAERFFTYPPERWRMWKDLGGYVLVYVTAPLHFFAQGSPYVMGLFPVALSTWAGWQSFRAWRRLSGAEPRILFWVCMALPSLSLWTAGLHKDVFVYVGMAMLLRAMSGGGRLWLAGGLVGIVLFRNYLLAALLPALLLFYWGRGCTRRGLLWRGAVLAAAGFAGLWLWGAPLLAALPILQAEFMAERGASTVYIPPLDGSWSGLWAALPYAWFNAALRPFLWECASAVQYAAALELCGVGTLWYWGRGRRILEPALLAALLCLALLHWSMIGLLVPHVGTLARYRALSLAWLAAAALPAWGKKNEQTPKNP